MDECRVIEVVETTLYRRGWGTPDSPTRVVTQYWSKDGELLAEVDPMAPTYGCDNEHKRDEWCDDNGRILK